MRRRSKRVSKFKIGPMTGRPIEQEEDQSGPGQTQPMSTQPCQAHLSQPSSTSRQTQSSQPHAGAVSDNLGSGNDQKKTRGPTLCLKTWSMADGQRIQVCFNNKGQPASHNATKFTNFLGTIARNGVKAPLTYKDWRSMPDLHKEDMWGTVQTKYDIEPCNKHWVLKSLAKKWRDFKAELKSKYYESHNTDEERLADPELDQRVEPNQWPVLVSYWSSNEGRERSVTNKANRAKQKISHSAGSKSFAVICREQTEKLPDGEEPSRADIYILTHTRKKDGNAVDKGSAEVMSKIRELQSQLPQGTRDNIARNDILAQVVGEDGRGCVRTLGLGPSPSDIWGPTPSRYAAMRSASEASRLAEERAQQLENMQKKYQDKVDDMQEKYKDMAEKYANIQEQMATMMSNMGGAFVPSGTSQVPDASSAPSTSLNMRVHSPSSTHVAESNKKRPTKKAKVQHMSTQEGGRKVRLMSFKMPRLCIALGTIVSVDPSTKVGGVELGPDFFEVFVEVAVMEAEHLIRPSENLQTIRDAVRSTIAWPAQHVEDIIQ